MVDGGDGAPTTAMRMSGPMRTAIMSFATCSPRRRRHSARHDGDGAGDRGKLARAGAFANVVRQNMRRFAFASWSPISRSNQTDLFGTQSDLFGPPPPKSYAPSLATVRAEANKVLEKARIAKEMPWTQKEFAFWKTVFPPMTNWLPEEEAAQLRSAVMEEICRLEAASVGDSTRVPAASQRKKKSASVQVSPTPANVARPATQCCGVRETCTVAAACGHSCSSANSHRYRSDEMAESFASLLPSGAVGGPGQYWPQA